jgi:hypothetical protein
MVRAAEIQIVAPHGTVVGPDLSLTFSLVPFAPKPLTGKEIPSSLVKRVAKSRLVCSSCCETLQCASYPSLPSASRNYRAISYLVGIGAMLHFARLVSTANTRLTSNMRGAVGPLETAVDGRLGASDACVLVVPPVQRWCRERRHAPNRKACCSYEQDKCGAHNSPTS